jgi:4-hydroxy-tetrahydrodipicolinate reductase
MKLALFGCGTMGRVVETAARAAGHTVGAVLTSADAGRSPEDLAAMLRGHDAAIDFSVPAAVVTHAESCARAGVPLVEGTTGWQEREPDVRRVIEQRQGALVYAANFSIGVNLFYRLIARAAELFGGLSAYGAFIEEAHHARKRDAPSGTAIRLRQILAAELGYEAPVASTRAGHIPGTHRVGFDSAADQITLVHTARSRDGFAAGALLAARWIAGRRGKGVYAFAEVLDDMLALERQGTT